MDLCYFSRRRVFYRYDVFSGFFLRIEVVLKSLTYTAKSKRRLHVQWRGVIISLGRVDRVVRGTSSVHLPVH